MSVTITLPNNVESVIEFKPDENLVLEVGKTYIDKQFNLVKIEQKIPNALFNDGAFRDIFCARKIQLDFTLGDVEYYDIYGNYLLREKSHIRAPFVIQDWSILQEDNGEAIIHKEFLNFRNKYATYIIPNSDASSGGTSGDTSSGGTDEGGDDTGTGDTGATTNDVSDVTNATTDEIVKSSSSISGATTTTITTTTTTTTTTTIVTTDAVSEYKETSLNRRIVNALVFDMEFAEDAVSGDLPTSVSMLINSRIKIELNTLPKAFSIKKYLQLFGGVGE